MVRQYAALVLVLAAAYSCTVQRCVLADTPMPRVVLGPAAHDLVVGRGMNAAGRDLRGCKFITQDLTGAVFDGCCLFNARIEACMLKGASFRDAVFAGAYVDCGPDDEASFSNSTINGVQMSSSGNVYSSSLHLTPTQLMSTWSYKNKNLRQCRISGFCSSGEVARFDFRDADLRRASLGGDLSQCDFTNARIRQTSFGNDVITFEQLASTMDYKQRRLCVRFSGCDRDAFSSTKTWDLSGICLEGSVLSFVPPNADFTDAEINGCTIRGRGTHIGLTKQQLRSTASFRNGDLTGLRLVWGDLSNCDLSGMNLTNCTFSYCNFSGTKLDDAVITGMRILMGKRMADVTPEQIKSTWNYKHQCIKGIKLPDDLRQMIAAESHVP